MIPTLGVHFRRPTMAQIVLFGLLALCATVDLPRNFTIAGVTGLGAATLGSCGIIWAVFLVRPVIPNPLLKAILFLIFFELYCSATIAWAHTGQDGVQMLVVGLAFLGLILISARETSANLSNGYALHRALLAFSAIGVGMYFVVVAKEDKLGDGVEGIISNRAFALYGLVVAAVALARWRANRASRFAAMVPLAWAAITTVAIALSMSRTALVCSLLLFPMAIFLRLNKKSIALSLLILIGGGVLFGIAVLSYQPLYDRFFAYDASIKVGGVAVNASGRTKIWELLLRSIGDNWIFGNGVASSQVLIRNLPGEGQPHNDYIRYYYDTGAFGLLLWLTFTCIFFSRTFQNLRRSIREQTPDYPLHLAALLAFTAVCGCMLTDNPVVYSYVMMPLAIVMGCSLGAGRSIVQPTRAADENYFPPVIQMPERSIRMATKRAPRAEPRPAPPPVPVPVLTSGGDEVAKVSVVMAVFNAQQFLREAVDSVLAQTFKDFEFIIINDGSTDRSLEILQRYNDPRIRIIDQANHGLVASLNTGIELAKGQYIARMDADDRCEPLRLELQARSLDRNPDIALIGGAIATMDELGNPLAPRVEFPATHDQIWSKIGRAPWVFCHPAVMFRRDAAVEVGMYHSTFAHAEDAEFFARLMSRYQAVNLPHVVLNYRLRRSAISFTKAAHGRINAELVATIIDRWSAGELFAPTTDERLAADLAIAMCGGQDSPVEIEAAYHLRLGRELLRGRRWKRAFIHYFTAAKNDPLARMAYIGMACAMIHYGGARRRPNQQELPPIRIPRRMPPAVRKPGIGAL